MEAGDDWLPALGAGQGTWANALTKQGSVLACLLILGFRSNFGLENKKPPLNSSKGKLGKGGAELGLRESGGEVYSHQLWQNHRWHIASRQLGYLELLNQ